MTVSGGPLTVSEAGGTGTFTVVLRAEPVAGNVAIRLTNPDPSEAGLDASTLTFTQDGGASPWDATQTVTVTGVDDILADGNQTVTIALAVDAAISSDEYDTIDPADVTVTVLDDDMAGATVTEGTTTFSENGGTGSFTVRLNTEPESGDVAISVVSNDTSEATVDAATLAFSDSAGASPWNTPQTVNLSGVDDFIGDGNQTFTIGLAVDAAASSDEYDAINPADVSITVTDDDMVGVTVSEVTTTFSENGGKGSFTVQLNTEPLAGDVVIAVMSGDTSEATVDKAILTFTNTAGASPWETPQTVTLTGQNDEFADGNLTFDIQLAVDAAASSDEYDTINPADVSVTVTDDDMAGVTVTAGITTISENFGSGSFTVQLNTEPLAGDVVITVSNTNPSEVSVDKTALTFTDSAGAAPWNTPQTVNLSGVDDFIEDGNQTFTIVLAVDAASSSDEYDAINPADVSVTVTDDDKPPLTNCAEIILDGNITLINITPPPGTTLTVGDATAFDVTLGYEIIVGDGTGEIITALGHPNGGSLITIDSQFISGSGQITLSGSPVLQLENDWDVPTINVIVDSFIFPTGYNCTSIGVGSQLYPVSDPLGVSNIVPTSQMEQSSVYSVWKSGSGSRVYWQP